MYGIEDGGRKTEEEGRRSGFMPGRRYIELAKSGQRMARERSGGTYGFRSVLRHFVPCVIEERIRPVAFLVDDAGELAVVAVPRGGWDAGEALNTAKRRVLQKGSVSTVEQTRERGLYLDDNYNTAS